MTLFQLINHIGNDFDASRMVISMLKINFALDSKMKKKEKKKERKEKKKKEGKYFKVLLVEDLAASLRVSQQASPYD